MLLLTMVTFDNYSISNLNIHNVEQEIKSNLKASPPGIAIILCLIYKDKIKTNKNQKKNF